MRLLAIDPGNIESGWCVIDETYKPIIFAKSENEELEWKIRRLNIDRVVIEMVASYGMPVGQTVFDTVRWIGRFEQVIYECGYPLTFVTRKEYVTALCGTAKAKDANIIQYLIDRFAPYTPNRGKGTIKAPGFFFGFKQDVWQSYALGVYEMDRLKDVLDRT